MAKTLAHYTIKDLFGNPLKNIPYQITDGNDKHIAKGFTNSKGQTYKISKNTGIRVKLYVKITLIGFTKIDDRNLVGRTMEIGKTFPGAILETELREHKGNKGEYKRKTHVVKSGETLSGIANKYGTSAQVIAKLNNLKNPDKINVGQILKIPPKEPSSSSATNNSQKPNSAPKPQKLTGTYTVKKGDTLASIAKRAGKTSQELAQANNISNPNRIQIGQRIVIPSSTEVTNKGSLAEPTKKESQPTEVKQIPVRSESSGTPKVEVIPNKTCECQKLNLIWGSKVSCEFRKKIVEIAKDLWPENYSKMSDYLMAIIAWESGGMFKSDAPNRKNSGATGLIQIMPATYEYLTGEKPKIVYVDYWGTGKPVKQIKQLADMTEIEYLDLVKKYFESLKGKKLEFVDLYLKVLLPVSSGKSEHVVFASSKDKLSLENEPERIKDIRVSKYAGNSGLDINKDGKIYKSEIAKKVQKYVSNGEAYKKITNCVESQTSTKAKTGKCLSGNGDDCICQGLKLDKHGFILNKEVKNTKIAKLNWDHSLRGVKAIVLHRTAGSSAMSSINWGKKVGFCAHLYVDNNKGKDGQIYQALGLTSKADHMGARQYPKTKAAKIGNYTTLSIEVSGLWNRKKYNSSPPNYWEELTTKQAKSVACLLLGMMKHFDIPFEKVLFHEDLCSKKNYEGRAVWQAIHKYLPVEAPKNPPTPYRSKQWSNINKDVDTGKVYGQ